MKKEFVGIILTLISAIALKNFLVWFVPVAYYIVCTILAILKYKKLGKKDE